MLDLTASIYSAHISAHTRDFAGLAVRMNRTASNLVVYLDKTQCIQRVQDKSLNVVQRFC